MTTQSLVETKTKRPEGLDDTVCVADGGPDIDVEIAREPRHSVVGERKRTDDQIFNIVLVE